MTYTPPRDQHALDQMIDVAIAAVAVEYAENRTAADDLDAYRRGNPIPDQLRQDHAAALAGLDAARHAMHVQAVRAAVITEAVAAGTVDAQAVADLFDPATVIVDADTFEVHGADVAVQQLLEARPYLRRSDTHAAPTFDGGARGDGAGRAHGGRYLGGTP